MAAELDPAVEARNALDAPPTAFRGSGTDVRFAEIEERLARVEELLRRTVQVHPSRVRTGT